MSINKYEHDEHEIRKQLYSYKVLKDFMISQTAAFVIALLGLIATMAPSEKRDLLATLGQGRDGIYEIEKFLYHNKRNYDAIKSDILFLEYIEEGFRVIQNDNIKITSVHVKSGWEV